MGNHHSQEEAIKPSISRTQSSTDFQDKTPTQIIPIDKLAKILAQKSLEDDSVQGITCRVFTKVVFPHYPGLAQRLFAFLRICSGNVKHEYIGQTPFKQQAEKLIGIMTDTYHNELYVKMFAEGDDISQANFRELLMVAYQIAMDFYPAGSRTCVQLPRMLQAVVDAAFHRKEAVPSTFLAHWLEQHCPRMLVGVHRYVVHVLTTVYRTVGTTQVDSGPAGLGLSTPILEKEFDFSADPEAEAMLPLSEVWLLSTTLPQLYTQPSQHHSPSSNCLSSQAFIAKMLGSVFPSHWALLYNSNQHGIGANRFMHHVLGYRGPTLTFLRGEGDVQFCLAASCEWKESHQYWGGEDCAIIQILPLFHLIQRGAKLLYLNTTIRGYPKGLRAGLDPRKPSIDVNDGFTVVLYCGIPYQILSVEVWGCGTQQLRDVQLDIKKWQVKQAERQQQVKINASDWVDHPDRYLLELAGRQTYTSS